jgi:DNA-binding transcriptional MerR regulator
LKRAGGRRYYRPDDVELLRAIRHLLYGEGYTIKGVQRILKEQGARAVIAASRAAQEDGQAVARGESQGHAQRGFAQADPYPSLARDESLIEPSPIVLQENADQTIAEYPGAPDLGPAPRSDPPGEDPLRPHNFLPPQVEEELRSVLAELAECGQILETLRSACTDGHKE